MHGGEGGNRKTYFKGILGEPAGAGERPRDLKKVREGEGIHHKIVDSVLSSKFERGRMDLLQTSNVFAPSSHTSFCTFPTLRQTGQLTTLCSSPPSFVALSPSPHPAHRSALTRQLGWKTCAQTASSPPSFKIPTRFMEGESGPLNTSGKGSSSEGPTPQLVSWHLKPARRSLASTRCLNVGPGAGGGIHSLGASGS